jgi:hypothetical protein
MSVMDATIQTVITALVMIPIVAFGQTKPEEPNKTTMCEVVKSPALFSGKIITLRAPIQIAFENFGLSVSECADKKLDYVWLEYARGPKKQPTTWCCGDMVPRDPLGLKQNSEFQRFHRYITAEKRAKGCYDCYLYHVTATLTGRFDAVETEPCPGDVKSRCCGVSGGFGHFGMACGRLVIRAVSDVVASPVDPSVYDKRK